MLCSDYFFFRMPSSEVTKRTWTELCHLFERGPNVKMVVQNLRPLDFCISWALKTAYFHVALWQHRDLSANIFRTKRTVNKEKTLLKSIIGSLHSPIIWRTLAHKRPRSVGSFLATLALSGIYTDVIKRISTKLCDICGSKSHLKMHARQKFGDVRLSHKTLGPKTAYFGWFYNAQIIVTSDRKRATHTGHSSPEFYSGSKKCQIFSRFLTPVVFEALWF